MLSNDWILKPKRNDNVELLISVGAGTGKSNNGKQGYLPKGSVSGPFFVSWNNQIMRAVTLASLSAFFAFVLFSLFLIAKNGYQPKMPFTTETDDVVTASQGNVIMGHLGNATLKEELGRSTWKLLHTMVARYPEEPTTDEREALGQFIKLLSRLYPCGECAEHFQLLLEQYPPQTASRIAASQWACAIHNKVNERLHKDIFDCGTIEEKYPCGCDE